MRLCQRSFAITCGLFFGGTVLVVSSLGAVFPGYGTPVLELFASLYPGYRNSGTLADVLLGAFLAIVDGVIGGWIFAWLYNRLAAARD